ncbi:hypothetical protein NS220_04330 [Microbacterium testaceum]|uniref:Uncharacterized protein n=1 Tax=Microbacterium testaceum TaxID=2033 RepID=A0A147EZP5_MICTE|nr:hypothetical protein NS220_04330 [Microbacterium testaceum]
MPRPRARRRSLSLSRGPPRKPRCPRPQRIGGIGRSVATQRFSSSSATRNASSRLCRWFRRGSQRLS